MTEPTEGGESAIGALATWANGLDGWVRMVTAQVLSRRTTLDDDMIDAAYEQLLAEKHLTDDAVAPVPTIEITEAPADDAPSLRLIRIGDTSNVNRLVDGQELGFNDRMTVVYGENASGKTGYARVLKRVTGARSAGRVLPDVYTSSPGTPTATLEYALGTDSEMIVWEEGSPPVPVLERVCVFDAPAAPLHVDDDLTYLYTPTDIALFEYVHAAVSKIRDLLSEERTRRAPKGNPFLSRFRRGTAQFAMVESLHASTDVAELRRLAGVVEDEDTRIADLGDRIRNLEGAGQQAHLAGAQATQTVCGSAVAVADRLLTFDSEAYASAVEDVAACRRRVQGVSEALFSADDLPGVFTPEWNAFITAAHQYGVTHVDPGFPDDAGHCPYCRQTLGQEPRGLLQRYRSYLVDDSQAALRTAGETLDALIKPVADMPIPDEPGTDDDGADDGGLAAAIGRIRALGVQQQARLSERLPWDLSAELDQLREDRQMLDERRAAAARAVRDLSTEVSERERQLGEARATLLELEDRRTLRSLLNDIVEHVEALKWIDRADTVLSTFQGLLRSVTEVMKDATREILNSNFESAFQRERQLLNCPAVRLEFPGRQAAALRHKSVGSNYRLGEILSEGEQKVIALADFLAEVSMRPSSAPVILDDPITSLDARRVDEVADRIVNLSAEHQVIIFTHHLYFATKLLTAFEQSSRRDHCSFYEVLAEDGQVGLVSGGPHPRMDTVKAIAGRVNKALQDAQAASGAARSELIATAYGHMRGWIEAFIEDALLQGSVKRHRANISIDALSRVNGQAVDEAVRILQPVFERACERMWPHAHTADQLQARPTLDEAAHDWQALNTVAEAVRDGKFPIEV